MQPKHIMLALAASLLLSLNTAPAFAQAKVGVVNVIQALLQSEAGKRGVAKIESDFAEQKSSLETANQEVNGLLDKLKKDTELMSNQEFNQLLEEIQARNSQLVARGRNFQLALDNRQDQLVKSLQPQLVEALEKVVSAEGLDVVISRTAVVYVGDLSDVTLKVTEQMNLLDTGE